ncbi:MAG: tetratricopeptide repeat protein [Burkholderiales bacterium]|nr:tetratricopeptide repeat protein [Burkholderiales bacterium]
MSAPDLAGLIAKGLALHQQGRLQDAAQCYEQVLAADPRNFDALHLMAVLQAQAGRHQEALAGFDRALAVSQSEAALFNNRGNTLKQLERVDEALASFAQALRLDPDYTQAHRNLGMALHEQGRFADAASSFAQVVRLQADSAEAWNNLGVAQQACGRLDDALASYAEAIRIRPGFAEAHCNRANTWQALGRWDEALAGYADAARVRPDHADAWFGRANVQRQLHRFDDALESYGKAIRLRPGHAEAWNNRGLVLGALQQYGEAIASYSQAVRVRPGYADACCNRGVAQQQAGQFDEALASFGQALACDPGHADARLNRGLLHLHLRRFAEGFADGLCRWDSSKFIGQGLGTSLPSCRPGEWRGRILLWAEQGLGDEVLFAGLLPLVPKDDVALTLSADRRLHPALRRSFPHIELVDRVGLAQRGVDTAFDAQAPIGDLGYLLGLDEAAIRASRKAFLYADPARRQQQLAADPVLRSGRLCGIAWRSTNASLGADKSLALLQLEPLLKTPGLRFVNLQYGPVHDEIEAVRDRLGIDIHQVPGLDPFDDIEGLLALIDACDIVVTTSNVTAHLAGAIGKRAAVLVPAGKGRIWYWHAGEQHSLWYPSLRMFGQQDVQACAEWVLHAS